MTTTCPGRFAEARILLVSTSQSAASRDCCRHRPGCSRSATFKLLCGTDQGIAAFKKGNYDLFIADFTRGFSSLIPKTEDAYNNPRRVSLSKTRVTTTSALADFQPGRPAQFPILPARLLQPGRLLYYNQGQRYDFAIADFTTGPPDRFQKRECLQQRLAASPMTARATTPAPSRTTTGRFNSIPKTAGRLQ